jgi:glycosyltransferase involved in cell wall biosynthesis
MKNVSVSVIVPCYNCSETVERAVLSVVQQTVIPREIILVNDGSCDNGRTLSKLYDLKNKFQQVIPIIVLDLEMNQGAGSARNKGWDIAEGEFVAFLDADDIWYSEKISIQYQIIKNHNIILCAHKHNSINNEEEFHKQIIQDLSFKRINKLKSLFFSPFSTPSVMIKRDIPFRFKYNKRYSEDYLLWLQILLSNLKCCFINASISASLKPLFGAQGLTSHMWEMEKGEIQTYRQLYDEGYMKLPLFFAVSIFSVLKFIRRKLIVYFRKVTYPSVFS